MKLDYSEIYNNKNNNNNLNTTPPLKSVPDNNALVLPGSQGGKPGQHGITLNENADPESCRLFTQYTNKISGGSSSIMVCADIESSSENINKFTCVDAAGHPHNCCPNEGDYLIIQSGHELICSSGGDYPEKKYGCVGGSGGMCMEIPAGQYDTLKACEKNCSKISLGFFEDHYLGRKNIFQASPTVDCTHFMYDSSGRKKYPSSMCVYNICDDDSNFVCYYAHDDKVCELDVAADLMSGKEDIGDIGCFKVNETIAQKCPHIKTTGGSGCKTDDTRSGPFCNINSITNPRDYKITILGKPPECGSFNQPCGWYGEDTNKHNYCENEWCGPWYAHYPCCGGNAMKTMDRTGEIWRSSGWGKNTQPACAFKLEKLPPQPD